jgi:PAS domain S-box-containing protein
MNKINRVKTVGNPRFWLILALLVILALIHYPEQLLGWKSVSLFSFSGLTAFIIERMLLLIPIIYAAVAFKTLGGITTLVGAVIIMFPRNILLSSNPTEAWVESTCIIIIGLVANIWIYIYRSSAIQLKNTEKMLTQIIDGTPIPCFAINTKHKVTYWNRALEAMSGLKREEIINTDQQWRAFYPDKRPVLADLIIEGASEEEIINQYPGKSRKTALIEGAFEAENFLPAVGTNGRWLRFTASPIRDSAGVLLGAIETLEDNTEQKKVEEALLSSEKRFRDLFESALDPIWVHDLAGNIILVNKAAAECTGRTVEETLIINVKSILSPHSLKLAQEVGYKLLQHETIDTPYEQKIIRKDGGQAIFMVRTNLLLSDGKPVAFQNIARDVTETKQMMENLHYYLQQITRAQEDERKRISRELHDSTAQNLIALLHKLENVIGKVKLLPDETKELWGLHEQTREILREVRGYSHDLRPAIIDDLGLVPALEWATDATKNEYKINTTLKVTGNRRRLSPEAELLLFRIVQEALRNVGKHAHATLAQVTVEFGESDVSLTITDNGNGSYIPDDLGKLTYGGKLGLVGMRERAQLLGGTLKIDSAPGRGTTITVSAPV